MILVYHKKVKKITKLEEERIKFGLLKEILEQQNLEI